MFIVTIICSFPSCLSLVSKTLFHHNQKLFLNSLFPSFLIGVAFHIYFAYVQKTNMCSIVSTPSPQHKHLSFPFPILLQITSFTGSILWRHFHIKRLRFCVIFRLHKNFHVSLFCSFQLLPPSCCLLIFSIFISLATICPVFTVYSASLFYLFHCIS